MLMLYATFCALCIAAVAVWRRSRCAYVQAVPVVVEIAEPCAHAAIVSPSEIRAVDASTVPPPLSRPNVPFRALRKRVSKMTGLHGVFTSKRRERAPPLPPAGSKKTPNNGDEQSRATSLKTFEGAATSKEELQGTKEELPGEPLSTSQRMQLTSLDRMLFATQPALKHCRAHEREPRQHMLLRFLRAHDFQADKAAMAVHRHAAFYLGRSDDTTGKTVSTTPVFDVAACAPQCEYGDGELFFVCGRDIHGRPVLVARPCVHVRPSSIDEAEQYTSTAVKHTLCTLVMATERDLLPGSDGKLMVLYDCAGVTAANCDVSYARQLVPLLGDHFPERVKVIVVLHNSWAVAGLWAVISRLVCAETKRKIIMIGSDYARLDEWLAVDHEYRTRVCHRRHSPQALPAIVSTVDDDVAAKPSLQLRAGEQASFVISSIDGDSPIIYASDAFLRCTGYSADDVVNKNCRFLCGTHRSRKTSKFVSESIEIIRRDKGESIGGIVATLINYRRDGSAFLNELHIAAVRAPAWDMGARCWTWRPRALIGVQIDRTPTESPGGSLLDPAATVIADGTGTRLAYLPPPSLARTETAVQNPSEITDPAQWLARTVEMDLAAAMTAGSTVMPAGPGSSSTTDDEWLLALVGGFEALHDLLRRSDL